MAKLEHQPRQLGLPLAVDHQLRRDHVILGIDEMLEPVDRVAQHRAIGIRRSERAGELVDAFDLGAQLCDTRFETGDAGLESPAAIKRSQSLTQRPIGAAFPQPLGRALVSEPVHRHTNCPILARRRSRRVVFGRSAACPHEAAPFWR
jgi:hypothetical protein